MRSLATVRRVGLTLGVVGAALVAVVLTLILRARPRRRAPAPVEIRPGDPVVGLPPRVTVIPRPLPADPRALTGPSGIGKSTSAYEYAHRNLEDFRFVGVVHASRPSLIPQRYADFATALGIEPTADPVAAVHEALKERGSWLIVFDDAGTPGEMAQYLPPDGNYLVTSSAEGWPGTPLEPFTTQESADYLRDRCRRLDRKNAKGLAEALAGAPLALELAAGFLDVSDMDDHAFLVRLQTQMSRIRRGALPALWSITASLVRTQSVASFEALEAWAVLGPAPIPLAVLGMGADADLLARLGLVVHTGDHVVMHPLVAALVRSGPDMRRRAAVIRAADALRAYLTDASDARWRALLPQAYAILERPELDGDRTSSWLRHHLEFVEATI